MQDPDSTKRSIVNLKLQGLLKLSVDEPITPRTYKFLHSYCIQVEKSKLDVQDEKGKREIECLVITGDIYQISTQAIQDFLDVKSKSDTIKPLKK